MTMKLDPDPERECKIIDALFVYFDKYLDWLRNFYLEFFYIKGKHQQLPSVKLRILFQMHTVGMFYPTNEIHIKFRLHAPNKMKETILHELIHYLIDTLLEEDYNDNHPPEFWTYLRKFKRYIK